MHDEPRSLPAVRYYADGRSVLVESLAEFEALDPGHADHPDGPFPTPPAARWEGQQEPVASPKDVARALHRAGESKTAIAKALGVAPRTVGRWLEE